MDIRVYLAGGKEKSSEKKTKKVHKRPNEEGKVPKSKQKFLPAWKTDFPWVYNRDGTMFCSVCEERPNLSDSFTMYPHLCLLQERHAVELGQTYRNDKACKDFIVAISDQFKNELGEQLQRAQFLGIMADSATDVGRGCLCALFERWRTSEHICRA